MAWSKLVVVVCLIKEWDNGNRDNIIKIFEIEQLLDEKICQMNVIRNRKYY